MQVLSDNTRGAGLMCLGMAGFTLNDTVMKIVVADMQLFQAIFLRGVAVTVLIALMAWRLGSFRSFPGRRDGGLILLRAFAELGATFCFLSALVQMPIANVTAILQILPLTVAIAAFFVLGERFRWHRGIAIFAGLLGVLFIIRPGTDGFNAYSLLALCAVLCMTLRDLSARKLSRSVSSMVVTLATSLLVTLAAGAVAIWLDDWSALSPREIGLLGLCAVLIFLGYYGVLAGVRVGDVSFIAPFRYTGMIWAIGAGWIIFSEAPDGWAGFGMAVIAAAGVYTWYRERKVKAG